MIDPDSTSYPTTAVIQLFDLEDPEDKCLVHNAGHAIHQACRHGTLPSWETLQILARGQYRVMTILAFLQSNHERAARLHGYWAIDKETTK